MRRLFKRFGAWLDGLIEASERRTCQRRGHDWRQTGALYPVPAIWFECRRLGCDEKANLVRASVTWHGPHCYTLTPVYDCGEKDWPEVVGE